MRSGQLKHFFIIPLIYFAILVGAKAEVPPPGFNNPPEVVQYRAWLKNNGAPREMIVRRDLKEGISSCLRPTDECHPVNHAMAVSPDEVPLVISPPMSYKKSQEVMLKSAPAPGVPPSPYSTPAFNSMMNDNMPLTPQQVVKLHQMVDRSQRAASIPPTIPPKPVSTTVMMDLSPGATPPAIRLAQGYVTSLVFVDSTGSPWPIASYDIGDPKSTNMQWDGKSNILLVQATTPYGDSNLVVRLMGFPTPLTLQLVSGQRVVDYRADIHIAGIGPNTKDLPTGTPLPNSANQLLLNVLDGVAPGGSKLLTVRGGDGQAWVLGDKMYLRTRLTVLSPGWIGKMTSPDGMYAYEMQTSSSVLVSQYGEPIEIKIEGF